MGEHPCLLCESFKCNEILLNLKKLIRSGTFDNLTNMIFNSFLVYWVLIVEDINYKLIYYGFDGVIVFTSVQSDVTM
jgi:hypothetical protein